jgi:uncharacterized protein YyaL (SSP411 family)
MSSQLKNATSPYLVSHKDSPVEWRLWSADTLAEAKKANKPIFLSLGYSGCHWCHVMARESFADAETAAVINRQFIPVIVDREERPDLDQLFQSAANMMGHNGGWPLTLLLTPEGLPFWVTGYLPKEERLGLPALKRMLGENAAQFEKEPDKVREGAEKLRGAMDNLYNRDMRTAPENINLDVAALRIAQRFDLFFGGLLQGATKFPNALMMQVLWRGFLRTGTVQFSQLVFTSLDGILLGGLYDHIGGGFFRHTVDERWMTPHFEKTLYDNALLIDVCTELFQFNRNGLCRQRVSETIGWLLREMKIGEGFAGGLNPDSEGEEGKFYLWSEAEIDAALVGTFSARFKQIYGVSRDGNYMGRNILRRLGNPAPASDADEALLAKQREMLLASRAKRVRPARDDKLMADWNGLAIAALARAGMVFEQPEWIGAAIAAFDFIVATLGDGGRLAHSATIDDKGRVTKGAGGFADDYANMARAALQLWEVTGNERFLAPAKAWAKTMTDFFWDDTSGGYCFTASDAEKLFVRTRMLFDSPAPAANGTMLTVLTRLAFITGETEYMGRAQGLAATFGDEMNRVLNGSAGFIVGYEYLATGLLVVVIGHKGNARTQELMRTFWGKSLPGALLVQIEPGEPLPKDHPATGKTMQGGQPTVYVCQRGVVSAPITDPAMLAQGLTLPLQLQQQQKRTA